MNIFVRSMFWESEYEHYPTDIDDLRRKIDELDHLGGIPFYIDIKFTDESYIGIILGMEMSCFVFGVPHDLEAKDPAFRCYYTLHIDDSKKHLEDYIVYSFYGEYGERPIYELIPKERVLYALYYYIHTKKLPTYLNLDDKTNQLYIDYSWTEDMYPRLP